MSYERRASEILAEAAMKSNEAFAGALRGYLNKINLSPRAFAEKSKIPVSTISKILSESRNMRLSTLRTIIHYVESLEETAGGDLVIGIIAARPSLDAFSKHMLNLDGKKVAIREYPANNIEDAIINGIRAERDKVSGLVCASIVGSIIEKFVRIPIVTIRVSESEIVDAISTCVKKVLSKE